MSSQFIESVDQLGRKIILKDFPKRIISLVPSQTELLFDLGLSEEVAGITKFCIHPDEWFRTKKRAGGTKKINFNVIESLKPDLIIGNKEENDQGQIQELMKHYPVWMSDIKNLEDALEMIEKIGEIVNKIKSSKLLIANILEKFYQLENRKSETVNLKVAYFIWRNPLMTVGCDTFIHDMLSRCGFENIFADRIRYPEITEEELKAASPQLIMLSSEPYPFKEDHKKEISLLCSSAKVILVDGEMFSWYGSRLLKAPEYFLSLLKSF